jgi:DNA polymerase-3 subunit epsilon
LLLDRLPILALDCQATGSPARGHLLEIGWSRTSAASGSRANVESRLIVLPDGISIPERVRRLTGISERDTREGVETAGLWSSVVASARDAHVAVIHFASYEMPHLRKLHRETSADEPFPFHVLCTHRIAKRLIPRLPRHSLRALAGYFGHPVPELRRAAHHVAATVSVWSSLVTRLEDELAIESLEELLEWLSLPVKPSPPRSRPSYPMPEELFRSLPRKPGVYRMLRSNGDVLYVGKAASLRERVGSYFRARSNHPGHILEMLSQARGLETTSCRSALEAALRETDEIKKLSPPYNKALRAHDRKIVFMNGTLTSLSPTPDRTFRLGPLPGSRLSEAFVSIRKRLLGDDVAIEDVTASEGRSIPDESTFQAGFALFRERLGGAGLLGHGATLWPIESPDEDDAPFQLEMQYEEGARRRWTAEGVVANLDATLRRVAHWVRRAHWLSLLSESTLVWQARTGERLGLVIEDGRVVERPGLSPGESIPEPARPDRDFPERRLGFDVERYDRLVVLTKELRRLLCEEREVMLSIGRGVVLDRRRLGAIFQWI